MKGTNTCTLYQRTEKDEPDSINPSHLGTALRLQGPHGVLSMAKPLISVDIWENNMGNSVVQGTMPLLKTTDSTQYHDFEQFKKVSISGADGASVVVEYLALTYGVFAHVEVSLVKSVEGGSNDVGEGEEEQVFDVYGTISSHYKLNSNTTQENQCVYLFDHRKESYEVDEVELGEDLSLSRSVVAVPAYSSLVIELDLTDYDDNNHTLIAKGTISLEVNNNKMIGNTVKGPHGVDARVIVTWREPFQLDSSSLFPQDERVDPVYYEPSPISPSIELSPLVELFSVFIGRKTKEDLSLYGMINFLGIKGYINLFNRDKTSPYNMPVGTNFIPLKGPKQSLSPGDLFSLSVDLQDVKGRICIKGVAYSGHKFRYRVKHWFDRNFCCVIQGDDKDSFAALHYNVFSSAVTAKLKVQFFRTLSSRDATYMSGSLVASYDKYACTSQYEKDYYRSVLFQCSELRIPGQNFEINLSRSVVAVPVDCLLVIGINLSCSAGISRDSLVKRVDFKIGDQCQREIKGSGFGINVDVEWAFH